MADSIIPVSDEQAKAIQEALKTLQRFGGFVADTLGTVPQDVIGLLGADWIKVRRAENLQRIWVNLQKLELLTPDTHTVVVSPFGREFLRVVSG